MSRPAGSTNIKPTSRDEKELYKLLKKAASEGDTNAAGWLLVLKNMDGKPPLKVINGKVVEIRGAL